MKSLGIVHSKNGVACVRGVLRSLGLAAMMLAAACLPGFAADGAIATATSLSGGNSRTVLTITLDHDVQPQLFTLANPYRVVIDLPNVVFRAGEPPDSGKGLVSAYRYGLMGRDRSRVVLDVKKPVKVEMHTQEAGEGRVLILDLVPTSREAFLQAATRQRAAAAPEPPPAVAVDNSDTRPLIVLDPGHGGVDSGARSRGGEQEKDAVLQVALDLRKALLATGHYRVLMTREDDTFVALGDRVKFARDHNADLFMSIHADSLARPDDDVRGATVYTLSDRASDREAAALAEKENRADLIAGVDLTEEPDDVAGILIDLTRRETRVFSARFARDIVSDVRGTIKLNRNPVRSAGFRVLKAPDVPSVLMELGYMSNSQDLKLMLSESWREKAVSALVEAIDSFFGARVARVPAASQ